MVAGGAGCGGDQHTRLFLVVFALTPLLFFAGLQFIIYTVMALVIFVLHPRPFLRPTGQEYCFFVLIAVLLVSAFKNLLEPGQDFRVLAASYNALLLLTGTLLLQQVREGIFLDESFNTKLLSICRILFFISVLLVVGASAYAEMTGATGIVLKSLFGLVTPSLRPGLRVKRRWHSSSFRTSSAGRSLQPPIPTAASRYPARQMRSASQDCVLI
jgi:hypothetical protein